LVGRNILYFFQYPAKIKILVTCILHFGSINQAIDAAPIAGFEVAVVATMKNLVFWVYDAV